MSQLAPEFGPKLLIGRTCWNGAPLDGGATKALFRRYLAHPRGLPLESEDRKAESTLHENEKNEAPRLLLVFGKMKPSAIKPLHIYKYLDLRAAAGAPAKANKEIALLSAVLEFGCRKGELELNPCCEIKYNKTRPDTRYVKPAELDLVMQTARDPGGMYVVAALCLRAAYLTVSRPDEMRHVMRQSITADGMEMLVGKRRRDGPQGSSSSSGRTICGWSSTRPWLSSARRAYTFSATATASPIPSAGGIRTCTG